MAQNDGIELEAVNDYSGCLSNNNTCTYPPCFTGGGSLSYSISSATAFINTMLSTNSLGFTEGDFWENNTVYDTDFLDPDITGANSYDDDTWDFDENGYAISYYQGHGLSLGGGTSQTCTAASQCNNPPSGTSVGTTGYGTCAITPASVSQQGLGWGYCIYAQTPQLVVCSPYDSNGHEAALSPYMALGENSTVGAWRGAATNGGTALAIVRMSWGMSPFFPWTNWAPAFAGLQIYAGMMVPYGDTNDSAGFGGAVASVYNSNASSTVASGYTNAISSITDGGGCGTGGLSYHGGINGCGCQVAATFTDTSADGSAIMGESWSALQSNAGSQTSTDWLYWTATCNYDPSTYPWSGGG